MSVSVKRLRKAVTALVVIANLLLSLGVILCSESWAAWTVIDGGGSTGLNTGATNPQKPAVAAHNNALYAAWPETASNAIIIKKFDGSSWSNAGTSGATLVTPAVSIRPALASYNGSMYAAYVAYDSCWGNNRIRIKKFDGSSWSDANNNQYNITTMTNQTCSGGGPANPYPGVDINHMFNAEAVSPSLLVANGKLYAAWMEWPNSIGHYNIRVAVLDTSVSQDWQMVDGGNNIGLNYDSTKDASQMVSPLLAWYNSKLYVGWVEANVRSELRVKQYTPAAGTWAFVDGGTATGLNYDPPSPIDPINRDAMNPQLVAYNNVLYAIWSENTYNDPDWGPMSQLRYKKFNGIVWSVDGSGADGGSTLNYAKANPADEPKTVVYNNQLKLAWTETRLADPWPVEIRVASFDGTTRSFIDSTDDTGININTAISADQPALGELNGYLYAVWRENNASSLPQIRAKKMPLPPYVTSVSVPANATYKIGDSLNFTVTFNKVVTVTGSPSLPITLDTGGAVQAAYVSGSGTTALLFRYTVQPGNLDSTGITVGAALNANGGTLRDADADSADLTLNSVASTTAVLVDGIPPTLSIGSPSVSATSSGPVTYIITYSGASSVNLTNAKVTLNTTGTASGTVDVTNGTTNTPTVTISAITGDGTLGISIGSATASDAAGNSAAATGPSTTFIVANTPTTATLAITINGSGSVNSHNQGLTNYACNKASSGTCDPVTFGYNDTVTLTPTGSNSTFSAWSGDYSGTNNPGSITMNGDKAVTATFTPDPAKVMIDGDATWYYALGTTLNAPAQDAIIRVQASPDFIESIVMTNPVTILLKGGYIDANFSNQGGFSIISGSLKIKAGRLIADHLKIKP